MDAKIDVESDAVLNLVKSYKDVNNDLETMASGCKKPDIPKCLDIGSNIDGLMGVVQKAETELSTKMLDVVGVLNDTIDILKKSDGFDLVELYHIEDNFDIKYNGGDFVEQILKDEAKITMEEFIDLLNCSDSMFSNLYDEIKKDFQSKLILEHQSFLMNKEPKIINGLIESIYVSNTKYKIGTEDFKKGLEDFKNTFANFVLSNNVDYQHDDKYMKDESNIPSNMWFGEEIADYDKALLLLSFGKQDIIGYNIGNFCRGYENNNFEYKYDTFEYSDSFQTLINANNWFNNDFENYDIKQIVSDYQALLEGLTSSANSNAEGVINIINSATGKSLDKDLWIYALDENHYLDSMYRNNPNLTTEDIVQNTFNGSYLSNVYSEYGIDGLNSLLGTYFDSILDDKDLGLKSCLSNGLLAKLSNVNCFENVYRSISVPTEDYISKKLELDRSKENFNMALACSLDTSNVTHKDRVNALIYLGDNAKYLEWWQIDTYALLWNKDTNIDFEEKYLKALDDKVYNNTVASGKGYDAAIEQLESMNSGTLYSGNEILKIIGDILGEGYSIAGGLYDGILNSIKGVARLVNADGIMSVDDYRQSYLQELLNTDFRIYADYRDINSANHDFVVNMLSNNYDLDNLSKYKDKNGMNIFDSEYLKKAEENNLTLYEMLYQKGYINQDEYLKYYNLDQRKNDGNMWLYSRLGENLVFKDIGKWTYNISSGVGNMVIPMALSAFVNPAAMSAWMFASVTGNEREQLLLSGKNNDLGTYLQAASKGLMAVGTEKFLGALTGYGAKADDILSVFKMDNSLMTKFMSTGFGKTFAKVLSNQVNESVEELVENVGNHLIDLIADGTIPDGNALWKEAWMTVLTTFATTPLINLMGEGMQESKHILGELLYFSSNSDEKLQRLLFELNDMDINSEEYSKKLENATQIAELLSANPIYRLKHLKLLSDIAISICHYKGKIIESKNIGSIDYDGINIGLYGDNLKFLENAVIKIKRSIDKLPKVLRGRITNIKIYDTPNPANLYWLLKYYPKSKFHYSFKSSASCNYNTQTITFYKEGITLDTEVIKTLRHELGHSVDATYSSKTGWLTEITDIWENAKKKDSLFVSLYGNTDIKEDFAEAVSSYFGNETFFRIKCPNRAKVLDAIFDAYIPGDLTNDRKVEIMEMFKGNGYFSTEMFHKLFEDTNFELLTDNQKNLIEEILSHDGISTYDELYKRLDGFDDN